MSNDINWNIVRCEFCEQMVPVASELQHILACVRKQNAAADRRHKYPLLQAKYEEECRVKTDQLRKDLAEVEARVAIRQHRSTDYFDYENKLLTQPEEEDVKPSKPVNGKKSPLQKSPPRKKTRKASAAVADDVTPVT
jgi:hypothetical protein